MKRYLLFKFDTYRPLGGWIDLFGTYETLGQAIDANLNSEYRDGYQIVDFENGQIVVSNSGGDSE